MVLGPLPDSSLDIKKDVEFNIGEPMFVSRVVRRARVPYLGIAHHHSRCPRLAQTSLDTSVCQISRDHVCDLYITACTMSNVAPKSKDLGNSDIR